MVDLKLPLYFLSTKHFLSHKFSGNFDACACNPFQAPFLEWGLVRGYKEIGRGGPQIASVIGPGAPKTGGAPYRFYTGVIGVSDSPK